MKRASPPARAQTWAASQSARDRTAQYSRRARVCQWCHRLYMARKRGGKARTTPEGAVKFGKKRDESRALEGTSCGKNRVPSSSGRIWESGK